MQIEVEQIVPNPFRDLVRYPLQDARVTALMDSIDQTEFWDNILLRVKPGETSIYELAYGHHRLAALKRLGVKTIDVPVKVLDDATMLKIMGTENHENWSLTPGLVNETVKAAKDFIEAELAKFDTWEEFQGGSNKFIRPLVPEKGTFQLIKKNGAGQTTILKFLGNNWKQWQVQEALKIVRADEVAQRQKAEAEAMRDRAAEDRKRLEEELEKPETELKPEELIEKERQVKAAEMEAAKALTKAAEAAGIDREAYELFNTAEAKHFATALNRHKVPRRFHKRIAESILADAKNSGVGKRVIESRVQESLIPLGIRKAPKKFKVPPSLEHTTMEVVVRLHESVKRLDMIFSEIEAFTGEKPDIYNFEDFYVDKSSMQALQKSLQTLKSRTERINFEEQKKEISLN
jgi:ParB-like chromosome segregation protein Spo0J